MLHCLLLRYIEKFMYDYPLPLLPPFSLSVDLTSDSICVDGSSHILNELHPLVLLQINPEKAREEFRSASKKNGGTGVKDFMDGMGLGMLAEQVKLYIEFSILKLSQ